MNILKTAIVAVLLATSPSGAFAQSNKEIVLDGMTGLFVRKDATVIAKYWDPGYIQHNPHVPNGTDPLKGFITSLPANFSYVPGMIVEDGDYVMLHGRYTGFGPNPMIGVDIFRLKNGKIAEHWDVLQDEVPADKTASGNPMFTNPQK
jgi:predicted SnoaL-like aldol condensation-catalyzing enzyme